MSDAFKSMTQRCDKENSNGDEATEEYPTIDIRQAHDYKVADHSKMAVYEA
jgi:hypothetical protein